MSQSGDAEADSDLSVTATQVSGVTISSAPERSVQTSEDVGVVISRNAFSSMLAMAKKG